MLVKLFPIEREKHEHKIKSVETVSGEIRVDLEYSFPTFAEALAYDGKGYQKHTKLKLPSDAEIKEWLAAKEATDATAAAQAAIDEAQDKVITRLAHDMAILFKRIKTKGFVAPTATEKKWLDSFIGDYDDWIAKQEA
jgi:hypothetical protein